ncbi:MAG TPA: hypothetical protein VLL95_05175, partial [Phnomibacter sp.]|nr:hypothetical protein [Phnomibacter sp.]
VAGGVLLDLVAFYGTGSLDGTTKQQEFFGKGGFTSIGVADDVKSFAPGYFSCVFHLLFVLCRLWRLLFWPDGMPAEACCIGYNMLQAFHIKGRENTEVALKDNAKAKTFENHQGLSTVTFGTMSYS